MAHPCLKQRSRMCNYRSRAFALAHQSRVILDQWYTAFHRHLYKSNCQYSCRVRARTWLDRFHFQPSHRLHRLLKWFNRWQKQRLHNPYGPSLDAAACTNLNETCLSAHLMAPLHMKTTFEAFEIRGFELQAKVLEVYVNVSKTFGFGVSSGFKKRSCLYK